MTVTLRRRTALAPARAARAAEAEDEDLTPWAWADRHLLLPRGSGMTPHQSEVTPYWRHWLAIVAARIEGRVTDHGDHLVESIDLVTGTQVGKTQGFLLVVLAWVAALFPRDTATVLPSEVTRKAFSKNRVRRAFEHSPRLADLLPRGGAEVAARLGLAAWILGRQILFWKNGAVALELRGDDVPLILADEYDALPEDVDREGDPFRLMSDRQKSYPYERLLCATTTPTVVNSHGWRRLCEGTHERLHLRCQGCGAHHWLDWDHLKPVDPHQPPDAIAEQDAARWHCPTCQHAHTSDDRDRLVAAATATLGWSEAGGWIPGTWAQDADGHATWTAAADRDPGGRITALHPVRSRRRSGHLSSLYARSLTLGICLAEARRAEAGNSADRQAFVNGWRAEPYEPRLHAATAADLDAITAPADALPGYTFGSAPTAAQGARLLLTCDQQGIQADRAWFPWVCRAWMSDGTSYLVEAGRADGWPALDALAKRTWLVAGLPASPGQIAIDSANGQMLRPIREWCARDPRRRLSVSFSGTMAPDLAWAEHQLTPKNAHRLCGLPVVWVGNHALYADELYDLMRAAVGKPAWILPHDAPDWYRASLTSEHRTVLDLVTKGRRTSKSVWEPRMYTDPQGRRFTRNDNHWLDCERLQLLCVAICRWLAPPDRPRSPTPVGQGERTHRLTQRRSALLR
jgi:hypothetical protein